MTISNKLKVLFQNKEATVEHKTESYLLINNNVNILRQCSIKCKCGAVSVPIGKKGNVFRCINCTKEHQYINYNLERLNNHLAVPGFKPTVNNNMILNMDYYEDAIKILQKEYRKPFMSFMNYFKF